MKKLKYDGYNIVFQEVPDEVSLAINVTGCPHHCEGCHSSFLWKYQGNYIGDDLDVLMKKYKGLITCVCLFGGDQNIEDLKEILIRIKNKYKLKTCLYSGLDDMQPLNELLNYLDYIKIGSFKKDLGGLDNKKTNQKFYKIKNKVLSDITYRFQMNKN